MSKIAIGWGDHCQYYINVPPANAWPKTWKKFQKLKSLSMVDSIQICLVCNVYAYKGANQAAQAVYCLG